MDQIIINWLLGALGAVLGFLLNQIWQAVKDLQKTDETLADKLSRIEVLMAGHYVSKTDFSDVITRMFVKLDSIENKLDKKVDK